MMRRNSSDVHHALGLQRAVAHLYLARAAGCHLKCLLTDAAVRSPTSNTIAYTTPATVAHDAHTPRVVEDDVIINLITGVPTTTKNVLCTVDINDGQIGAGAVPACFSMPASVGIAPWAVSCWPYDSQFSWSPDGKTIAFSHTNNT